MTIVWNRWRAFWFAPAATTPLEVMRIGLGMALIAVYGLLGADFAALYGGEGWIARSAARAHLDSAWAESLLFHTTAPWQETTFLATFIAACSAFVLGWQTRWVKWVVLAGQISLAHCNPAIQYGLDNILSNLLFVLCIAPVGAGVSLDRWRTVRRAKMDDGLSVRPPPFRDARARACLRLVQFQMAGFLLLAGATKLQGQSWQHGDALWIALMTTETAGVALGLLASGFWIVKLLTYGILLMELTYPFLIWGARTRPWVLTGALSLHASIAILVGLYAFSFVMMLGHLAFLRERWLERASAAWRARFGGMEMVCDVRCAFCVRSMAAFLAFDGLAQIRVRDCRAQGSPLVCDQTLEPALYLITRDGRALPGFDAYRYAVLRVPGLWWLVPFFYVPLLSRAVGRPVYAWMAAHRHVVSTSTGEAARAAMAPSAATALPDAVEVHARAESIAMILDR